MNTVFASRSIILLCTSLFISYTCSKQDDSDQENSNPDAESINTFIGQLPGWEPDTTVQKEPRLLSDITVPTSGDPYKCEIYEKNLVRTFQNILSVETNFGIIWPGALIQGNTLKSGELKNIPVKRAPLTLQINIPLEEGSAVIDDPNSINVQQAISDFQIAAGQMPDGSQSGAGIMNFSVEEASSFDQSMLAMGFSAGFTDPQSQVGLDASANVSVERSYREHTVIAKFVQQMFTVRFADDLVNDPASFFAVDVKSSDLEELKNDGYLGADNTPLYIESVTYGRIMLFTMKSTSVSSGSELSAALQASMSDYVNGGASLTEEQREILENSTTTIFSAGGTKEAANEAIADLNWSKFFKAAPATTAIPLSFVAKTLKGKEIVRIVEEVLFNQRDNCQAPSSIDVTITWYNNDYTGACTNILCPQQVWVTPGNDFIGTALTVLNDYSYHMHIAAGETRSDFTIDSQVKFSLLGSLTTKNESSSHDARKLKSGNTAVRHVVQTVGGSVALDFNLVKTVNYGN
jgi:Thiol-activated cytolysin